MNKIVAFLFTAGLLSHGVLAQSPVPPETLTASWAEGSGSQRTITLNWSYAGSGHTGFLVERKIGTTAWADLPGATALAPALRTYSDLTIPRGLVAAAGTNIYVYYRLRAKGVGTVESGAAEVATIGLPYYSPAADYDSDADGIKDAVETASGLNSADWADGTGDSDGDLLPNAWEIGLSSNISIPNLTPIVHVTVDASRTAADTATETKTITAAIGKLTGAVTATPNPYRVILVKPGVYNENINNTSVYQIALIADRTGANPKAECEIQGISNSPVITTTGSLVVDGFVITRAPGTQGGALASSEIVAPVARISQVCMVNCIVRNMALGAESVIKQTRGRLVLSHCTFFMNSVSDDSLAHSYSTGVLTGTSPLESTARLRIQNCVFWNPVNTRRPEFHSVGEYQVLTTISYGQALPGTVQANPGLTPKGYLMSASSLAAAGGTTGIHVLRDMHGELRYNPPGRGADDWNDTDSDQIPDFADTNPLSMANAGSDDDSDSLTELGEYQASTSIESADSQYLTLEQALRLFSAPVEYLTRTEADSRYMPLNANPLRQVRIAPGGNIDMGEFGGSAPAP